MNHSDLSSVQTRAFAAAQARLVHEAPVPLANTWYRVMPLWHCQVTARSSSSTDLTHWNGAHRAIAHK